MGEGDIFFINYIQSCVHDPHEEACSSDSKAHTRHYLHGDFKDIKIKYFYRRKSVQLLKFDHF